MDIDKHPCWVDHDSIGNIKPGKRYTLKEVLDRLLLTDEELLLCQQHREYAEKLDEMFEGHPSYDEDDDERMDIIGQNGNDGLHYGERVFGYKKPEGEE
ncbi:MAG: hypothetical protein CMI54_00465 [Parcubacteria group bacterium]|nr:hypothetical protein [Parcubacteria group bacterium]